MKAAWHPVGRLPSSVYWRRRLVLLLALIAVLALVRWALIGRGNSEEAVVSPAASRVVPASSALFGRTTRSVSGASPSVPASGSPAAALVTLSESPVVPSGAVSGPSPPSPRAGGTTGPCGDDVIMVSVAPDAQTYPPGSYPTFTLAVENSGEQACHRDVGTLPLEIVVRSGVARVWSSDDCQPVKSSQVGILEPGQPHRVGVTWPRQRSAPACWAVQGAARVEPGQYDVVGRAGTARSEAVPFTLR